VRRAFVLSLLLALPVAAQEVFVDVAKERGLEDGNAHRNVFSDLDGDGWVDLIVDMSQVYRNVADGPRRRFAKVDGTIGGFKPDLLLPADLDDDGDQDAFVGWSLDPTKPGWQDPGRRSQVVLLRHDVAAITTERAGATFPPEPLVCAAWLDADLDGRLDLVTAGNYVETGLPLEAIPVRLWRGLGDGAFEEVTDRAGLALRREPGEVDSRRPVYGLTTADVDGDGWPDILVCAYGRQRNLLYLNQRDGTFRDIGLESGFAGDEDTSGVYSEETKAYFRSRGMEREDEPPFRSNGNTFDAAVGDYDGDGDLDIFLAEITHSWAGPSSDLSSVLENLGTSPPRFRRHPQLMPRVHRIASWNQGDLYAGWLDAQNDGRLDLALVSGDYPVPGDEQWLRLFVQGADGRFTVAQELVENPAQLSLADLDRDGGVDLLTGITNMRMPAERARGRALRPYLFENRAARGHWVELRLVGRGAAAAGSNRDAIGARVVVTAGGRAQAREVQGGRGHAGHLDAHVVHVGLGDATTVDRVVVRWPTRAGTVTMLEGLAADHLYVVHEPVAGREALVEDLGPH
jgi:enediyne biosynthesis protein E4